MTIFRILGCRVWLDAFVFFLDVFGFSECTMGVAVDARGGEAVVAGFSGCNKGGAVLILVEGATTGGAVLVEACTVAGGTGEATFSILGLVGAWALMGTSAISYLECE